MLHNILNRLSHRPCPTMLMIWMLEAVLMKDNTGFFRRESTTMEVPVMSGISALYGHIIRIPHQNIKILRIQFSKRFLTEHLLLLLLEISIKCILQYVINLIRFHLQKIFLYKL